MEDVLTELCVIKKELKKILVNEEQLDSIDSIDILFEKLSLENGNIIFEIKEVLMKLCHLVGKSQITVQSKHKLGQLLFRLDTCLDILEQ